MLRLGKAPSKRVNWWMYTPCLMTYCTVPAADWCWHLAASNGMSRSSAERTMSWLSTMFVGFLALVATAFAQPTDYGYDLEANTPFAHVINGGPVADASRLGFAKVRTRPVRSLDRQSDAQRTSGRFHSGTSGPLLAPRGGELPKQNLAIEFMLDPLGSDQRLDVFVSGKNSFWCSSPAGRHTRSKFPITYWSPLMWYACTFAKRLAIRDRRHRRHFAISA